MTVRTFDAAAVSDICNNPTVLPTLSLGRGEIDVTSLIADHRNLFFLGEFGGAMFHRVAPDVYAAHDFFLPEGRGQWALRASRQMLKLAFDHGAKMVFADTPIANRACRMFNRWLGFQSRGISTDPVMGEVETFVLYAAA